MLVPDAVAVAVAVSVCSPSGGRMLALYRAGRQADALDAYRRLRATLADQLGLDPSPRLSGLEHDILVQSPDLDWAGATPGGAAEAPAVPSQQPASRSNLPAPVASFIGRKSELVELGKLVERDRLVTDRKSVV